MGAGSFLFVFDQVALSILTFVSLWTHRVRFVPIASVCRRMPPVTQALNFCSSITGFMFSIGFVPADL